MLVIGLMVLLTGLAWPALDQRMKASQLGESSENMRAALRMARATAGLQNHRMRIRWKRDEQQPLIEFEVDPMNEPGHWEPITQRWSENDILLGDVQVVQIIAGRPDYLTPI